MMVHWYTMLSISKMLKDNTKHSISDILKKEKKVTFKPLLFYVLSTYNINEIRLKCVNCKNILCEHQLYKKKKKLNLSL